MEHKATEYDAVLVGSGPNGLAAAVTLARNGLRVLVIEGRAQIGGGTRTAELTLPGFHHDVCSSVHPMGVASPFFRSMPMEEYGVEWLVPEISAAHPMDGGKAVAAYLSLEETATLLGEDGSAYRTLLEPALKQWDEILPDLLAPLHFPEKPVEYVRTGAIGMLPATWSASAFFRTEEARALYAGMAGHSILSLKEPMSSAYGYMMLLSAHAVGWPVAKGGSQMITAALTRMLEAMGGEVRTGHFVKSMDELPPAKAVLFDTSPRAMVAIAGERLPSLYRSALERFRLGAGVFKVDWALDAPIPWTNELCGRSATVHLGGTMAEIAASEQAVRRGKISDSPYCILTQPSLIDASRAPAGKHTAWAYCHVPNGATVDMTAAIEAQVERFAPGFGERVLARHTMTPAYLEAYNPNYIGGDINGGIQDLIQHFVRPTISASPYRTPGKGIYLCSSSTPPGGGVHGMCGLHAANAVLQDIERGEI
jgi:phytoene dehydrogenase-like protein